MSNPAQFRLQTFLPDLLNQTAEEVGQGFDQIYKDRYGMLRTEWRVLAHLGQFGPLDATQIGSMTHVHKTKISRAVTGMEARNFITRTTDGHDRRRAVLCLTQTGQAAYVYLSDMAREYNKALLSRLTPQEHKSLLACLQKLGIDLPKD
jgi:DNA-binding MarR family transcriptional regulator